MSPLNSVNSAAPADRSSGAPAGAATDVAAAAARDAAAIIDGLLSADVGASALGEVSTDMIEINHLLSLLPPNLGQNVNTQA